MQIFHFFLSLHHSDTRSESTSILLCTRLQIRSKKLFLNRKKYWGRICYPRFQYDATNADIVYCLLIYRVSNLLTNPAFL